MIDGGRLAPVIKLLETCNLACGYCYQEDLLGRGRRMSDQTLERILSELARIRKAPLQVLWFGGEPTQVGRAAFERAVLRAEHHLAQGGVRHALQTNATLVDDRWAELLARHRFTVTVSLDGFPSLHDHYRKTPSGKGSHAQVMNGVTALLRAGIRPRASCVLTREALPHAEALVEYLAESGVCEADFPPAGRYVNGGFEMYVTPVEYGDFMARVLERWLGLNRTDFRIRGLAGLARAMAGKPPSYCKLEGGCSQYATFSHDGLVYPCDEFSGQADHLLGDVMNQPLDEILASPRAREIHTAWASTPEACRSCEWLGVCRGGCPFERRLNGGADERTVLCEGYKVLFARMAREVRPQARPKEQPLVLA